MDIFYLKKKKFSSAAAHRRGRRAAQHPPLAQTRSAARDPQSRPAAVQRNVSLSLSLSLSAFLCCLMRRQSDRFPSRFQSAARDWLVQPLVVDAFHHPSTNEISEFHPISSDVLHVHDLFLFSFFGHFSLSLSLSLSRKPVCFNPRLPSTFESRLSSRLESPNRCEHPSASNAAVTVESP